MNLDPELRIATKVPRVTRRTATLYRLLGGLPIGPRARDARISEHSGNGARVRLIVPEKRTVTGALLWMHGGGLVVGAPRQDDARCAEFAARLGIAVVCAHYRLAPKHPFPAALDDCRRAWRWLLDHAEELGFDPARVAVGGESAGGGLAAALAQRTCDQAGPRPAAQLLVYPMLDDRTAARRELDALDHPVWNNASNRFGWSSYLGREPGSQDVPEYAVPARRADLSGMPPAWIGVGSLDLFLEEGRAYAQRLQKAGVRCEFTEFEAACHGFIAVAPAASVSRTAVESQMRFLEDALGLSSA